MDQSTSTATSTKSPILSPTLDGDPELASLLKIPNPLKVMSYVALSIDVGVRIFHSRHSGGEASQSRRVFTQQFCEGMGNERPR